MTSLPDFQRGIDYWTSVDASVDGVLGGFGTGPLPRVEQLSSRLFLLSLMPSLQLFSSPLATTQDVMQARDRYVALDVGAGVGRVTAEVLLPLVDDVITIEPVKHFIETAKKESMTSWRFFKDRRKTNLVSSLNSRCNTGKSNGSAVDSLGNAVTGDETGGKRVWFIQGALNDLDPAQPTQGNNARSLGVLGGTGADAEFGERAQEIAYDVIWCQWCLGHLNDPELVAFLKRAHRALRPTSEEAASQSSASRSVLVVKENVCEDLPGNQPQSILDEEDSSLTRSNAAWEEIFQRAGLTIVKDQVQEGLPAGLYMVKM
ncbi:hypothetical protein QFC24_001581 [Naganishia onofrii]|uniref:Uncharacterized protein n=1 Tax=Naganishia onofrii TaxID=1851511 RepID=A0ACC2XRQ8_9TREE|nr:hypothetical protein QFC24_001581 [Naganishia onofrii]